MAHFLFLTPSLRHRYLPMKCGACHLTSITGLCPPLAIKLLMRFFGGRNDHFSRAVIQFDWSTTVHNRCPVVGPGGFRVVVPFLLTRFLICTLLRHILNLCPHILLPIIAAKLCYYLICLRESTEFFASDF